MRTQGTVVRVNPNPKLNPNPNPNPSPNPNQVGDVLAQFGLMDPSTMAVEEQDKVRRGRG